MINKNIYNNLYIDNFMTEKITKKYEFHAGLRDKEGAGSIYS